MLHQKLDDINVSFVRSNLKSIPEIKFIYLVLLLATISKDADDFYLPKTSWISSKLLPYNSISCLTLSRSPLSAADSSGCLESFILGWPIDCGTLYRVAIISIPLLLLLVLGTITAHLKIHLACSKICSLKECTAL